MTNLEKLIQVLGETFPGTKFVEKEIIEGLASCRWIACYNHSGVCEKCPTEDFWHQRYVLRDLKPEPDADITTGYVVFVDDEGTEIPYSGCIHPTYSHAMDEMDQAEYHGWITSIQAVKFRFVSKGGGKNA
jgi:hypothetical protein